MSSHYNQNVNGWIVLDKPQGMSSNQALRKIQYMLHAKKPDTSERWIRSPPASCPWPSAKQPN